MRTALALLVNLVVNASCASTFGSTNTRVIQPHVSDAKTVNTTCTLFAVSVDHDLGTNKAYGDVTLSCAFSSTATYHLSRTATTTRALKGIRTFDEVALTLRLLPEGENTARSSSGEHRQYEVVAAAKAGRSKSHVVAEAAAPPLHPYFLGERRLRLLSVVVEANGFTVDYAGNTTAEREAWVADQREGMDLTYRWSTYGKLGFNATGSIVQTVKLGAVPLLGHHCRDIGFVLADLAAAAISAEVFDKVDAIMYYLPPDATRVDSDDLCDISGACYTGVLPILGQLNPDAPFPPFIPDEGAKDSNVWRAGCWVRNQPSSALVKAAIGAHEFGHHIGLNHAGGTDAFGIRIGSGTIGDYGDATAVMGNDLQAANSLTAVARYTLGTLPESAIARSDASAVKLQALSLSPDNATGSSYLAMSLECPQCTPRVRHNREGFTNMEMWITFRGDGDTCAPERVEGHSEWSCHVDHSEADKENAYFYDPVWGKWISRYNKVTIHVSYRAGGYPAPTSEKWYWLAAGETYTVPNGGRAVAACWVDEVADEAMAAVGATAEEALANAGDTISGDGRTADYYDFPSFTGWFGTLTNSEYQTDVTKSFRIKVATAQTMSVEGMPVDVTTTPLNLVAPGHNQIAYLRQAASEINDKGLPSIAYATNDAIRRMGSDKFSTYYSGYGWFGSLTKLVPGEGYTLTIQGAGGEAFYSE